MSWKAKCRQVAEWLGELNEVYGQPHFEDDEGNVYLDYTHDDAAAWRLHIALEKTFQEAGDHLYWKKHRRYGWVAMSGCAWHDVVDDHLLDTHVRDRKKAQVLLATHLIDKGWMT